MTWCCSYSHMVEPCILHVMEVKLYMLTVERHNVMVGSCSWKWAARVILNVSSEMYQLKNCSMPWNDCHFIIESHTNMPHDVQS